MLATNKLISEISQLEQQKLNLLTKIQEKEEDLNRFTTGLNLIISQPELKPREVDSVFEKLQALIELEPSKQEREKKIQQARQAISLSQQEIDRLRQQLTGIQSAINQKQSELHWQENYQPHISRLNAQDKSREYLQQFVDSEDACNELIEAQERYFQALSNFHNQTKGKKLIFNRCEPESLRYPSFVLQLNEGYYRIIESRKN